MKLASMRKISFVVGFLFLLLYKPAFAQNTPTPVSSADLKKFLTNSTFQAQPLTDKKLYHIFFTENGKYKIRYPSNRTTATGKWSVGDKGELCIQRIIRSSNKKIYITKCGKVARIGQDILHRYNDKGEHTVTLQFIGRGNQLPGGE